MQKKKDKNINKTYLKIDIVALSIYRHWGEGGGGLYCKTVTYLEILMSVTTLSIYKHLKDF